MHKLQRLLEIVGDVRKVPFLFTRLQQHSPQIKVAGSKQAKPFRSDACHQITIRSTVRAEHHAYIVTVDRISTFEYLNSVAIYEGGRMSDRSHSNTREQFPIMSRLARGHHV